MTLSSRTLYKASRPPLTPVQTSVLYGMVLGDAHARWHPRCTDASIDFVQALAQRAFIDHLHSLFGAYSWMDAPRVTRGRHLRFSTFTHPVFTALHRAFYVPRCASDCASDATGGYVKVIPRAVDRWLNGRVLAYHLMCDGSLATHGFSRRDCLCAMPPRATAPLACTPAWCPIRWTG